MTALPVPPAQQQIAGAGGFVDPSWYRFFAAISSLVSISGLAETAYLTLPRSTGSEADITALQGQIATLQGQVTTLNSQVTTLNSQVTTLQTQVTTLNTEMAAATAFIDALLANRDRPAD